MIAEVKPDAIANLKAHIVEPEEWLSQFARKFDRSLFRSGRVIVAPPFPYLAAWRRSIISSGFPITLAAQDLSAQSLGKFTGEVPGEMLRDNGVEAVILAHSERWNVGDKEDVFRRKMERAKACGLEVIYCVRDENAFIPDGVDGVAYEPPASIGTGKPLTPPEANAVARKLFERTGIRKQAYGGSVTADNVSDFFKQPYIMATLVGGASLKGEEFGHLAANAIRAKIT